MGRPQEKGSRSRTGGLLLFILFFGLCGSLAAWSEFLLFRKVVVSWPPLLFFFLSFFSPVSP